MLLMLTKQKGQSVDALHHDKSAMTALMAASSNGSLSVLHIILEAGAKVNQRNSDGVTALMHASVIGHAEVVRELIARGADLSATDNDGFDALIAAATGGSAEVSASSCNPRALPAFPHPHSHLHSHLRSHLHSHLDRARRSRSCSLGTRG